MQKHAYTIAAKRSQNEFKNENEIWGLCFLWSKRNVHFTHTNCIPTNRIIASENFAAVSGLLRSTVYVLHVYNTL